MTLQEIRTALDALHLVPTDQNIALKGVIEKIVQYLEEREYLLHEDWAPSRADASTKEQ